MMDATRDARRNEAQATATAAPTAATAVAHKPQILCVDDEVEILNASALHLRRKYEVLQATSGVAALEILSRTSPAVIISDMRMPGMDGATLLAQVHERSPLTSRVLLTGQADLRAAAAAVNQGRIFRFLLKPCETHELLDAVAAGVEQNRIANAERVLLEQTLRGAVKALADLMALIDPGGFGRSSLVKEIALDLDRRTGAQLAWQLEVATTFMHAGHASLPTSLAERVARGARLDTAQQESVANVPHIVEHIIRSIPRLEHVADILAGLDHTWADDGERVPRGARILRLAIDAAAVEQAGTARELVPSLLAQRVGRYEPALLDALTASRSAAKERVVESVAVKALEPGMILVEDLVALGGVLIVPHGTEVTKTLIERACAFPPGFIPKTVRVRR